MDMAILIDTPALTVTHDSRLVPREVATRVVQAAALMDQAQQAADRLREEAQQAAETLRQQAFRAYEQEKKRGWQDGWNDAQASMASALAEAAAARQVALHALAPELVELVLDAATKVIQGVDRRHLFARALASVDSLLYQARWARLRVAPQQLEEARVALSEAGQGVASVVTLVADPALGPDDAVFESDRGVCNASLSVQLQALEGALCRAVDVMQRQTQTPMPPPEVQFETLPSLDLDPERRAA